MDENYSFIIVHPFKFELRPCPIVTVGFEPLILIIDWEDNRGEWLRVEVQNFTRDNSTLDPVDNTQSNPSFVPGGPNTNWVTFPSTPAFTDTCYKYELAFHRHNGEVFIVDPTLRIRRVGP
jgi:hypothetical protein